jgi:hypothetical protein
MYTGIFAWSKNLNLSSPINSLSAVKDLIFISFMTFFKSSMRSAVFEFPALPNEIQTRGIATDLFDVFCGILYL